MLVFQNAILIGKLSPEALLSNNELTNNYIDVQTTTDWMETMAMPYGVTVFDRTSGQVQFPTGSAISCANGYLQFYGRVCFRGQVFPTPNNFCVDQSTEILLEKLEACCSLEEIVDVFYSLIGGWAAVYYREDLKKVIIGRDVFGRKSMLWTCNNGKFYFSIFASIRQWIWKDVPSGTITVLDSHSRGTTILFYTSDIDEQWVQQFDGLSKIQKSGNAKTLALSHELFSMKVSREAMAKVMLGWLKEATYRTFCDVNSSTKCLSISFSGGVDSLLIAHVLSQCIPSNVQIDLVNVAFDKKENYDEAPDRLQSQQAYKYLKVCYPERCLRLILVNIDLKELVQCRKKFISSAVAPASSVMDDSISCVQWFAARGEGILFKDEQKSTASVKSEAKIVVVGSGADELFGGYMRHRRIYLREGRKAVLEELSEELRRIGDRNLGRDDRVVSSLCKDLRAPFLDDVFVERVNSLPLECKTDFTQRRGIGEKWLIREALKLLGTPEILCTTPKRAMQFGTRVAKLENRKERGGDICTRLLEEN